MKYTHLFSLIFLLLACSVRAQEMVLVVERCKALDQTSPIHNIWTDEENIKWVANSKGLHKVLALDLVQKVEIPSGTTHLLTVRGGNAQVEWSTAEMQQILGNAKVTTASYDKKTKTLWVGTLDKGVFQFTLSPLKLVQQLNTSNSKLTSNRINDIFIHPNGAMWIATDDGMLTGTQNKWTLQERYLNFVGVDAWGDNMWILGDDFLWQVDNRGKWRPVAVEPRYVEGPLRDIAVDNKGRVWIASNIMTGYNDEANHYQRFGPGQYFTSQFVNCLDVDNDGTIWAGTDDKGLYLIQWEAAMTVNILSDATLDCMSDAPVAAITARVSGGEPPFTFQWNTGASTENLTSIGPGKYTVTVTDTRKTVKIANYEIPDPNLQLAVEIMKPATGATPGDGSAKVTVEGGSGEYTFRWDNGESQAIATTLTPGQHAVTVTDSKGCSAVMEVSVDEKIIPLAVSLKTEQQITCSGTNNGRLRAIIEGGKSPYQYAWSHGPAGVDDMPGLAPGLYAVTVADATGQTASATITLHAPPPLAISAEFKSPAAVSMTNGRAEVKAAGGTPPYSYAWDSGETTAVAKSLSPGTHTVTVTDAGQCSAVAEVLISEHVDALGVIIRKNGLINCHGQQTVSLTVDITGGKGPFSYAWSHGATDGTLNQIGAGTYALTVTDATGSTFTASAVVTSPEPLQLTATVESPASVDGQDGSASVKATGGTGTHTFAWSNGETGAKAKKLPAGLHTITVTDAAGCTAITEITIGENILAMQLELEETSSIACAGQKTASLNASVNGGKGPYRFQWSNGGQQDGTISGLGSGQYSVTVTDATGVTLSKEIIVREPEPLVVEVISITPTSTGNADGSALLRASGGLPGYTFDGKVWPAGNKELTVQNLKPGTTRIVVEDAAGCSASVDIQITEDILPLSLRLRQTEEIACAQTSTGALEAVVSGGKPPYQYNWRHGASGPTIAGLSAGIYVLEVRDASGLSATAEHQISAPTILSANIANLRPATNDRLRDGKASLEVSGGTPPYSFVWSSGETTSQATKLAIGQGSVTITDVRQCQTVTSFEIREKVLPELTAERLASGEPLRMEKIQFEADSVKIYPEAIPSLEELYNFLYDNPTVIIEVSGHTNSLPADAYCDSISTARAVSVAQFLIDKGIASKRIIATGYGKRKPVATNQTPEGRRRNQRVEIKLIRIEE